MRVCVCAVREIQGRLPPFITLKTEPKTHLWLCFTGAICMLSGIGLVVEKDNFHYNPFYCLWQSSGRTSRGDGMCPLVRKDKICSEISQAACLLLNSGSFGQSEHCCGRGFVSLLWLQHIMQHRSRSQCESAFFASVCVHVWVRARRSLRACSF